LVSGVIGFSSACFPGWQSVVDQPAVVSGVIGFSSACFGGCCISPSDCRLRQLVRAARISGIVIGDPTTVLSPQPRVTA